jgi:hypothetical protein
VPAFKAEALALPGVYSSVNIFTANRN